MQAEDHHAQTLGEAPTFADFWNQLTKLREDAAPGGGDELQGKVWKSLPFWAKLHLFDLFLDRWHDFGWEKNHVDSWCCFMLRGIPKGAEQHSFKDF